MRRSSGSEPTDGTERLGRVPHLQRLQVLLDNGGLAPELKSLVLQSLEDLSQDLCRREQELDVYDRSIQRLCEELPNLDSQMLRAKEKKNATRPSNLLPFGRGFTSTGTERFRESMRSLRRNSKAGCACVVIFGPRLSGVRTKGHSTCGSDA